MATIAYYRVSSSEQSIQSQQHTIEKHYKVDKTFLDEGVSGTVKSIDRLGFKQCLDYIREEDTLVVWDLTRLGRDSIDTQQTISQLKAKGVRVIIHDLGIDLNTDIGELVTTIMSKVAEMERKKILARTKAGRDAAIAQGKPMGRPASTKIEDIVQCRQSGLSITKTAEKLGCSVANVKRLTALAKQKGMLVINV